MRFLTVRNLLASLVLALAFGVTIPATAQTTSVTLTVQDTDAQTWNNGTWNAILIPSAGIAGPFFVLGTSVPVPNQQQSGSLSAIGNATMVLNSSNQISPGGSQWQFTVCPNATSVCFTQALSIQGVTQNVTLTPPAIRISLTGIPFRVLAYTDTEIQNPALGSVYYNVTAACQKLFSGGVWTCFGVGGVGTVTSVSGLNPLFTVANATTSPTFAQIAQPAGTLFGNFTGGSANPTFGNTLLPSMVGLTTNGDILTVIGGSLGRLGLGATGSVLGNFGGTLGYGFNVANGTIGLNTTYNSTGAVVGPSASFIDLFKLGGADFCADTVLGMSQQASLAYNGIGASGSTVTCSVNPLGTFQPGILQLPSSFILAQTLWSWPGGSNGLSVVGLGRGTSQAINTGANFDSTIVSCHGQAGCNSVTLAPTGLASGVYSGQALLQEGTPAFANGKFFGSRVTQTAIDNMGVPGLMTFWDPGGQEETGTSYVQIQGNGPYLPNAMFGGWDLTGNYGGTNRFTGQATPAIQNGINLANYEVSHPGTKMIQGVQVTAAGAAVSTCSIANAPAVTGNINATCAPVVDTAGRLLFVNITNPGYGYTSTPAVTLNGGATGTAIPAGEGCTGGLAGLAATGITVTQGENNARDASNPLTLGQGTVTLAATPPITIYPNMFFRLDGFANGAGGTVFQMGIYDEAMILTVTDQQHFTYLQPVPPALGASDSTGAGTVTFVDTELVAFSGADNSNRGFGNGTLNINNGCGETGTNNVLSYTLSQVSVSGNTATYTGTITNGGANALLGMPLVITGFTNNGNNNTRNTQTFIATGSTTTTITVSLTTQVNETHAGTATIASVVNNGEAQVATEVSTGQTIQYADHMEGAVVGNGVGEIGPSQGYIGLGNNPANIINTAVHLSARFGIPPSTDIIDECSGGNSGVQSGMRILQDDGNFNQLLRANGRCTTYFTGPLGTVGDVVTLSPPNSGQDVANGITLSGGSIDIWKGSSFYNGSTGGGTNMFHADYSTGAVKPTLYQSQTNCTGTGSAANPSAVACSAAPAGAFSCATNASTGTCVVSTSAVTTNSRIFIQPTASANGLTCNASADTGLTAPRLASQSNGVSFTINLGTFAATAECFNYFIIN